MRSRRQLQTPVRLNLENHSATLDRSGFVDEHHLGKPACINFVKLKIALINLFGSTKCRRIERLARILVEECEPGCDPLGPDNLLVMAPGVLSGTSVPTSGRISFGGKSPLTGGIKHRRGILLGQGLERRALADLDRLCDEIGLDTTVIPGIVYRDESGEVVANDRTEAYRQLSAAGLRPLRIRTSRGGRHHAKKISLKDLSPEVFRARILGLGRVRTRPG